MDQDRNAGIKTTIDTQHEQSKSVQHNSLRGGEGLRGDWWLQGSTYLQPVTITCNRQFPKHYITWREP